MRSCNKMGKGVTSSLKVSKSIEKKPQFSNLIDVLKPKVYITDSSKFMMLVQQLTGNCSGLSSSSCTTSPGSFSNGCSSDPTFSPPPIEPVAAPVIYLEERESFSTDDLLSFDSLEQYYLDDQIFSETLKESSNLAWQANVSFSEMRQAEILFLENNLPMADAERSSYQDLESWLMEIDQQPFQYQERNSGVNSMIGAHGQELAAFNLDDICSWLL